MSLRKVILLNGIAFGGLLGVLSLAEVSYALPGLGNRISRSSYSANHSYTSSQTGQPIDSIHRNSLNATTSTYSGLNPHEQAAAQQAQAEKDYEDALQAIKEGRYVPPRTGPSKDPAVIKAQLEEQKAKNDQVLAQKRLDREEDLRQREAAYFTRTKKGMEMQRKQQARSEKNDHGDVDPVKLQDQLKGDAEGDSLKNF